MMDGVAMLRGVGTRYRAVLLPLSEGGATIDYVLGATNYRSLRANEALRTQVNFRRLLMLRSCDATQERHSFMAVGLQERATLREVDGVIMSPCGNIFLIRKLFSAETYSTKQGSEGGFEPHYVLFGRESAVSPPPPAM